MTDFATHTIETAPDASKPFLEGAKKNYGFVPNLLGTMAESAALTEGYVALASIFGKTDLSETERQIITMTNNRLNGCTYCMAAHTTISKGAGVPQDVIDALRAGAEIADPKLEALRKFAVVINETRGWPSQEDVETFLAAGYTNQTVLEVVLGTAYKVLSNYTNHIAATELDAPFKQNAWSDEQTKAA
jgi:uncharacterized peroxidase-related enzyme